MNIYCTLFDSNYLDKGLVLYHSLCRCEDVFRLYVFAFDDRCRDILRQEAFENMVVVDLADFESPELLKVKEERTRAEYCWTCTPWTVKYVLENYHEPACTYIDADLMFFSSPSYLFDAMRDAGCSCIIVPHRLGGDRRNRQREAHVGKYCVEFNTFVNNEDGRQALDWWAEACLDWCFYIPMGTQETRYGDQKYLEEFPKRFRGVYICEEYGAGIAPWNAYQLKLAAGTKDPFQVEVIATGMRYPIVFFHYAGIMHLSRQYVNVNSGVTDKALHQVLCDSYVAQIKEQRDYLLERYGLKLYMRRKVTNNPIMAFYQRFISPIAHIRRLSDIYKI